MTDSLWLERSHRRIICEYSILMYAGRWCYPSTTSLRVLCDFSLEINLFGHQDSLQDWFRIWAACGGALQTSGARSVDCWFRHGVLKQEISNEKRAWLESCWDCQRQRSLNRAGKKIPRQSSQTTYFWCRSCPMSVAHHEFVFGSEAAELFGSIHGDCIGWYCTRNWESLRNGLVVFFDTE